MGPCIGVRISWLMLARNHRLFSPFVASSAMGFFFRLAASASAAARRSGMNRSSTSADGGEAGTWGGGPPMARATKWFVPDERLTNRRRAARFPLGVRAHGPAQHRAPPWPEELPVFFQRVGSGKNSVTGSAADQRGVSGVVRRISARNFAVWTRQDFLPSPVNSTPTCTFGDSKLLLPRAQHLQFGPVRASTPFGPPAPGSRSIQPQSAACAPLGA